MTTTNQRAVEEVAKVLALVQNGHPDYTPQPTADAFWGLLDDDQRERYRRMATAANKRTPGWRPISEAEACTPYLLWDAEEGAVTGFYYDSQWQTFDRSRSLTPTHFHELPTPPPPGEG